MNKLKNVTDEELAAEVSRRAIEKERAKLPQPKLIIDWSPLQKYVEEGVRHVNDEGYESKDFEHYIFELTMEAVYGHDFWDWWNNKL